MMKKTLSVLLVICMSLSFFAFKGSAEEVISGELNILTYNIAGLPIPSFLQDKEKIKGRDFLSDTLDISKQVGEADYDLVAVQEDFNAHKQMTKHMGLYPYQTFTSGGVPFGDGLNFFSKQPIYNIERITWEKSFGVLKDSSDQLTPKGILYCVWEIQPGIYVDVYTVHVEAGSNQGSLEARWSNHQQLAKLINERSQDRAVIALGDFNSNLGDADDRLYELLLEPAGLKDAWAEVHNGGVYFDVPNRVDGIDRVLYRDGGGIEFESLSQAFGEYMNKDGKNASDHPYCKVTLSYTFTGNPQQAEGLLPPQKEATFEFVKRALSCLWKSFTLIIKDLFS